MPDPAPDESAAAQVLLVRPASWIARFRRFYVLIDGEETCGLRNGERTIRSVPPGEHSLSARLGRRRPGRSLDVVVPPGSTTELAVIVDTRPLPPTTPPRSSLRVVEASGGEVQPVRFSDIVPGGSVRRSVSTLAAVVLVLVGQYAVGLVNRPAGLAVAAIGAIALVVLFFRRVRYRDADRPAPPPRDAGPDDPDR